MIDAAKPCIVDAGVGIKLFVQEEFSDQAALLFDLYTQPGAGELAVPDLFFVECANILWKHVRKFGYPKSKAQQDIQGLNELMLTSFPTHELNQKALDLAIKMAITAYDACYVVLAQRLNCPLITADERLVRVLAESEHEIIWLGDPDWLPSDE